MGFSAEWKNNWKYEVSRPLSIFKIYDISVYYFSYSKKLFLKTAENELQNFFHSTSIRSLSSPALIGSCAIPSTWSTISGGISISCSLIICWTGSWLKLFDLTHWKSTWRDLCSSFSQDNETNGLKIKQICFLTTTLFFLTSFY